MPMRFAGALEMEGEEVVDRSESTGTVMSVRASPNQLVLEILRSEYRIHQHLEVVAGRRVAVKVDRGRGLHDSAQFHQSRCHHAQVGQHVAVTEESHER